jgi:catechol 2,3-dioxygenase-like lactoylglutathione lyase family enzyme
VKIKRLDHLHIYCADPETSAQFYVTVFKADTIGTAKTSYGGTMHFLRLGGLALVLAPHPPKSEPITPGAYIDGMFEDGFGVAHFGLHVENLEQAVESIRRRGSSILSEPREYNGLRFAYVGGPDGVIIELLGHHGNWETLLGPPQP